MKVRSRVEFKKAFSELLKTKNVSKITVTEILKVSGYSRSSFYRNYLDYYDFVESLIREEAENLAQLLNRLMQNYSAGNGLDEKLLRGVMEHVYADRDLYHMILNDRDLLPSVTGMNFTLLVMNCFRDAGNFHFAGSGDNLDEEFYRYAETLRFVRYLFYWDANDYSFSPEYMTSQIMSLDKMDKAFDVLKK